MVYKSKIVLCGAAAVGKTALIHRYISSQFSEEYRLTMGVDVSTKEVNVASGEPVTIQIWDVGGQERFKSIRVTFYAGATGVMLVFDLTREETYIDATTNWLPEIRRFTNRNIPFVLIGNKLDLIQETGEVIDRLAARWFAEDQGSIYIETSALDGTMVDAAFVELTNRILASQAGQ